jgi:hypothetical protein
LTLKIISFLCQLFVAGFKKLMPIIIDITH